MIMNNKKNEISTRRSQLSPAKQALLEKRLRGELKLDNKQKSISRRSQHNPVPLSFAQQRLWFLAQLEPDNPFYNVSAVVRLQGKLNFQALQDSLQEIINRHEVLRCNFQTIKEKPVAFIHSSKIFFFPVFDISELTINQQKSEVKKLASQEAQQPFDLSSDLLLRAKLLRLNLEEHILLFTMHHIVSDGWSIGVLIHELATLYKAFCEGKTSSLPELPIQYGDFAIWQQEYLQGEALTSQKNYWKQKLSGSLPVLELPTDYPRPAVQSYKGKNYSFTLPKSLTTALKTLSQQTGTTLFMTLLTAFKILLYRYSQQDDIIIGTAIANRNLPQIEKLIGFFVNTLVLRTDVSGNPSFLDLLARVKETTLDAYTHQDLPFEKLVEEIQPERNLSHSPLFQVWFSLNNSPMPALEIGELTLAISEADSETAQFDLSLNMVEREEELIGIFEYSSDLFNTDTINRIAEHFQTLLAGIIANPKQQIALLPLLTKAEENDLLWKWNDTEVAYPVDKCIHELFAAQVESTPDAVAVVYENQQLTYRELNAKANQLAHYLHSLGVKPEVLVGICVERSLEMVIGLLAILKAGGVYVPLDPNYPQQRLAYMLEDSQPRVLLTQQHLLETLPTHGSQVICIDSQWELITRENTANPVSYTTVDNLAYVIYTSGSTGKPKGAMNSHRGVCNRLLWMQETYQLTAADTVLQKTPFSFDVSVWEFFWTLITGARLVVAQPEGHKDPNYLVNLIIQQQITTLHFVPSMLQAFLEAENVEKCQSIKRVIASGEALPTQLQQRFFHRLDAQLHNLYGPTEAAIDVTFWQCQDNANSQNTVPIGRPIANIQIYVLDKYLHPVPVGVTGEIYIGGVGVGRGYLNRPQLTAEKFIPNPFSDEPSARLYKTGDLARYLPNGEIEYLGRIDNQVKVRGFRIELGEIEAVISQYPQVRETVVNVREEVILREDELISKQLVAYIVAQPQQLLSIDELRRFLENKLPNYMVPSAFVMLKALPLTANGKLDRRALPAPDIRPELEAAFIAPQTTAEKQLADIWAQVLGLEKVGVNDNFFALGGDSILSLQIISKANQAGLYLTPKQMFQYQTIAQLAAVVGTSNEIITEQGLVTGSVPLPPMQHWFFAQNLPDAHHWNQSLLLEVGQPLDPVLIEEVVRLLLRHHDVLRLCFTQDETGWQAMMSPPSKEIPFTSFDFSHLSSQEQETAIATAADNIQASLNLSTGPLLRVAYFDLGTKRLSRLLLVIHHLTVDGVSWRILVDDFQTAYEQISQSQKIQLPVKTTSFKQWSERLQEYAHSPALYSEIDYWQKTVKSFTPLSIDYPGGENTNATARTISVNLSRQETQALLQDVPAAYRTQINDVLLAALVQTFSQLTGQPSLLIDLEGHGREEVFDGIDLSRTVGWFTSIFPVFLDIEKASNLGEALLTVKEQLRNIPQRGFGYGVLRYLSSYGEITEAWQLYQPEVVFNYLGQLDQVLPESSLFKLTQEYAGIQQSLQGCRTHLLELNGSISQGRLQMNWTYSENLHRHSTIEELAQGFLSALRAIIAHSQSSDTGGFTPSDFAEFQQSQWNQSDLEAIAAVIRGMS
jgi:amino acid adenylation domain-containing protein/non-ribosomal peptide synthase protein (TIGR01720 family)